MPPLGQQRHRSFDVAVSFDCSLSRHHSSVISVQKWLSDRDRILVGQRLGAWGFGGGRHESLHNFAAGQRTEIDRYEVLRKESVLGFGM